MEKVRDKIIISFVLITISVVYFMLPISITRKSDIKRGNELISNILKYKKKYGILPENKNWELLKIIGFTNNELTRAYPEYSKVNDSIFELIFIKGFDPPYLLWNSNKQEWDVSFPKYKN